MEARRDKHEPTPLEALEYIAEACRQLVDERWESGGDFEAQYNKVTLADIRRRVAYDMGQRAEYFTSDYRHDDTPMHSLVCGILGSTVGVNRLIDETTKSV